MQTHSFEMTLKYSCRQCDLQVWTIAVALFKARPEPMSLALGQISLRAKT